MLLVIRCIAFSVGASFKKREKKKKIQMLKLSSGDETGAHLRRGQSTRGTLCDQTETQNLHTPPYQIVAHLRNKKRISQDDGILEGVGGDGRSSGKGKRGEKKGGSEVMWLLRTLDLVEASLGI